LVAQRKENRAEKGKPMDRGEMIAILENIARDPKTYPNARVTAIRTLREFAESDEAPPASAWDDLDELRPRHMRTKSRR
jgi:hypothetical protein